MTKATINKVAILNPKAKTILIALKDGKQTVKQICLAASEQGIKLDSATVTAYAGSPTKHAHWDEVARGGETSWKYISLLGQKLIVAKKDGFNPGNARKVYTYELTALGKKAVKELMA